MKERSVLQLPELVSKLDQLIEDTK